MIQRNVFSVSCLSGGCHNAADQAGNLVLEEGVSYANLVGIVSANAVAQAAGLLRVSPGNPAASFLLIKLIGPGPGEGSRMPLGASPLASADIEQIRTWIVAGAPAPNRPTPTSSVAPLFTTPGTLSATTTLTPSVIPATPTAAMPPTNTPAVTQPAIVTPTSALAQTATPSGIVIPSPTPTPSVLPTPPFNLDSTLPRIQATIFSSTCVDLGCHNAHDHAGGLVLEGGQSYAALVRAVPQNAAASASGFLRVDPGNPDGSFLLTKLTLPAVFDPNFGSRMPLGKPPLERAEIERIRTWILRGALADESGAP